MKTAAAGVTDAGHVRRQNEDAFFCDADSGLFIVADGMGGSAAGATASKVVVTVLPVLVEQDLRGPLDARPVAARRALVSSVRRVSQELWSQAGQIPALAAMGAAVVVLLARGGTGLVVWAGDCRAYLLRGRRLACVTEDQTTAAALMRDGHLTPEAATHHPLRHSLEEFVGKEGTIRPGARSRLIRAGDRWLLCSDGVTKGLSDDALRTVLSERTDPEATCRAILEAANAADGSDNMSAIVADFGEEPNL